MIEPALIVAVGRADQRAPQPGQREDRASLTGGNDRAADQRQVLVAQDDVRATAGTDARQLRVVAELIRPYTGGVDDVRGADLELLAALTVQRTHATRAPIAL